MIILTKQADTLRNLRKKVFDICLLDMELILFFDPNEIFKEISIMNKKQLTEILKKYGEV